MNEIVIHFHLPENKHEIDAKVLNICEAKIIAILEQITETLGLQDELKLSLIARTEGGIRDLLKYQYNPILSGVFFAYIMPVLAGLTVHYLTKSPSAEIQNIESYTNNINELTTQIKQNTDLQLDEQRKQTQILEKMSVGMTQLVQNTTVQNDIKKKQSGLYKNLVADNDIEKFSVESVDERTNEFVEQASVSREEFGTFVLDSGDLEPEIDRNATIAIISPVLNDNGRLKWKGEYNGEIIDFYMSDDDFKQSILLNQVKFGANDLLSGVLKKNRKINEVGEEVITGYSVEAVFGFEHDDGSYTETVKGQRERLRRDMPDEPTTLYMDFGDAPTVDE